MTSPDHPTGTDRLAEARRGLADAIVVNVQGDEPLIEGFVVDAAVDGARGGARGADGDGRPPRRVPTRSPTRTG